MNEKVDSPMKRTTKSMALWILIILGISIPFQTYAADESLVVTESGNVVIGDTNTTERLTVVNSGKAVASQGNAVTFGVKGGFPAVTSSGSNYYRQVNIDALNYRIPQGVTDNGDRTGLSVNGYAYTDDFQGTLQMQRGVWIRVGAKGDLPGGTINNSVGLKIDNETNAGKTAILDSYAIYQSSPEAKNYFNGPIYVGASPSPGLYKMYVSGDMYATRIKTSMASGTWQDQVFEEDYKLLPLFDVEEFVKKNKHLPEVPSAAELEKKGIDTAEMLSIHMKKIEELTLYLIDLKKENNELKARIERIESQTTK